jgi:hypothetical protein
MGAANRFGLAIERSKTGSGGPSTNPVEWSGTAVQAYRAFESLPLRHYRPAELSPPPRWAARSPVVAALSAIAPDSSLATMALSGLSLAVSLQTS